MIYVWAVLFTTIAVVSWHLGKWTRTRSQNTPSLSRGYLVGLNHLLNEQPDKAVDVFVKMLEVDSETVETHFALGSLFRRRGEVDRAIRIHQNLIARPHLSKVQRVQALLALGRDYMLAGVLDRAERLFHEVVDSGEYTTESLKYLLDIYQQEKDWEQAIAIAERLSIATGRSMHHCIAHHYCELSLEARSKVSREASERYLKKALSVDKQGVRPLLLQGQWEMEAGNYRGAIRAYKKVKEQDADYLTEAILPLVDCYQKLGQEDELIDYLHHCLRQFPRVPILLTLSERLQYHHGEVEAASFVANHLQERPSLHGLKRLLDLQLGTAQGEVQEKLTFLQKLTTQLLKDKPVYRCVQCGFSGKVLHWLCPSCKLWSTMKPINESEGE